MDKVHDQVYVSDREYVKNHGDEVKEKVDWVLNVSEEPTSLDTVYYPLHDKGMNDQKRFNGAVINTVRQLEKGETVLVFCAAGVSRSPTVAATAIASRENKTWRDSFKQVKQGRKEADPVPELRQHARKYLGETESH